MVTLDGAISTWIVIGGHNAVGLDIKSPTSLPNANLKAFTATYSKLVLILGTNLILT
jgi:hypothetical protein